MAAYAQQLRNHGEKRTEGIIYWASTILLASGMLVGGLEQVSHTKRIVDLFAHLGYSSFYLYILGVWQILGVIAILIPKYGLLKEWTYAGLFFLYTGAAASHLLVGDPVKIWLVPLAFLLIAITSWKLRPDSRKLPTLAAKPGNYKRSTAAWFWLATGLSAFIMISGGLWLCLTPKSLLLASRPIFGRFLAFGNCSEGLPFSSLASH